MAYYMYVSLQDDDKILVLGMDSATGKLTPIADVPAPGGPSSSAISPDQKTFYVGHRNSQEIFSHRIDSDTGELTQTGRVSLDASPTYLSTDRTGRYLLSAFYQGAHVAVHPIGGWRLCRTGAPRMAGNRARGPRHPDRPLQQVCFRAPYRAPERQRDEPPGGRPRAKRDLSVQIRRKYREAVRQLAVKS